MSFCVCLVCGFMALRSLGISILGILLMPMYHSTLNQSAVFYTQHDCVLFVNLKEPNNLSVGDSRKG
uniref:Putative secreted protein n=1 Tax=Anopheles darlingi TaxID=43151 RepID=A0A2M4DRH7_ANODA